MSIPASTMLGARLRLRVPKGKSTQIGFVRKLLIESGRAKLEYVGVTKGRFFGSLQYYTTQVLEAKRGRLYLPPEETVSVDNVDSRLIQLEKASVYTKSGVFLGHIEDVYYDPLNFMVTQLEVAKRILFMPFMRLLIGRQDILDIKAHVVIVQDAVLEDADVANVLPKAATLQPQRSMRCSDKR